MFTLVDSSEVEDLEMVPHELAELVEDDLDLAMALYRRMPCSANLMYLEAWAPGAALLGEIRALLDEPDDALADPAAYWLWCGPFESDVARPRQRGARSAPSPRRCGCVACWP